MVSHLLQAVCATLGTATLASITGGANASPAPGLAKGAAAASVLAELPLSKATRRPSTPVLRSLEEQQGNNDGSFVYSYSLKFEGCHSMAQWNEEGGGEDDAKIITKRVVTYRLCPTGTCDAEEGNCREGYGEYAVDINTFVEAWMEQQQQQNENQGGDGGDDGAFDPAEFAECANYNDYYYIGPSCSDDGYGIGFGIFYDETCSTPIEDTDFNKVTGYSLPYSGGTSLIPDECISCNYGDDGMCQEVYQRSGKCETNMDISYPNENSCDYIAQLRSDTSTSSSRGISNGMLTFYVIFGIAVVLLGFYVLYLKKKLTRAKINLNEEGDAPLTT